MLPLSSCAFSVTLISIFFPHRLSVGTNKTAKAHRFVRCKHLRKDRGKLWCDVPVLTGSRSGERGVLFCFLFVCLFFSKRSIFWNRYLTINSYSIVLVRTSQSSKHHRSTKAAASVRTLIETRCKSRNRIPYIWLVQFLLLVMAEKPSASSRQDPPPSSESRNGGKHLA